LATEPTVTISENILIQENEYFKDLYSLEDIKKCYSKISKISFDERIDIFGIFLVTGISSGFCLGSNIFLIHLKVVILLLKINLKKLHFLVNHHHQ
jgi:Cft2 family RNA processing exonuclease